MSKPEDPIRSKPPLEPEEKRRPIERRTIIAAAASLGLGHMAILTVGASASAAAQQTLGCGQYKDDELVYDKLCGAELPGGGHAQDSDCSQPVKTGDQYVSGDNDCGKAVSGGDGVSPDSDCNKPVNSSGNHTDADCGKSIPGGGTYEDADCTSTGNDSNNP